MIYKISEVSNLETALLYPYRILRTASNTLCELLRYSEPFVTQLTDYTTKSGIIEYSVDIELNPNKVPFIEFLNADLLPETADIFEVETTENKLIIRTERILSKPVDIAVYEVYSLQQIADLLSEIGVALDSKSAEVADTEAGIGDIQIQGKWVISDNARMPDLVMIDKADDGLLYGDANCILSGAVSSQQLVNPSQRILESMLKCLTDQLTIKIVDKRNRIFEGFYNGLLTVDSNSEILVFRNCNAVIQLNKLDCNTVIIDNCPFVFFKDDSCKVGTLEIRHSTVTINSDTEIDRIMLSRLSTVNQVRCKLGTLLLLEAGSTYYVPELNDDNTIEHVEIKAVQGQFCVNDKPVYLHHQNVSFRRGQVEDPMPVTELKVDISISGGGGGGGGDYPDAPTDTHAGVIWNWFKYANIPNVSNRPELVAGIIGNCQAESYMAIDLLGCNDGYYGPWCESNADFRTAVTDAGFSFHPYTASPGDDSASVPTIFTWLTQQNPNWTYWFTRHIDMVTNQTGEAGARAYAELFAVDVEICIDGGYVVEDPGVEAAIWDRYDRTYTYQDLDRRRDNAANIYNTFMGLQ